MNMVYMDNAATTYPKPPKVAGAVAEFISEVGCNVGRGGYKKAYSAAEIVMETRERLCELFGFSSSRNAIFTLNVTYGINFILKGVLRPGDHVLTGSLEHNAVIRPLVQLAGQGIEFERIPCNGEGQADLDSAIGLLRPNTKMIIISHASNVSGDIFDVGKVGTFCREHGLLFVVDAAQTAGVVAIDMERMHIDALLFTGHKGLMGPQGIGGLIISDRLAELIEPLVSGGTGSYSALETMPPALPDRLEAGTLNLPGIYGLHAALGFLKEIGISNIRRHEIKLTELFEQGLRESAVRIIRMQKPQFRTGVVAVDFPHQDNADIAYRLEREYGVMVRCGLQCAPEAHRTLGTFPQGTVRFSFGWYNTEDEIMYVTDAIKNLSRQ